MALEYKKAVPPKFGLTGRCVNLKLALVTRRNINLLSLEFDGRSFHQEFCSKLVKGITGQTRS